MDEKLELARRAEDPELKSRDPGAGERMMSLMSCEVGETAKETVSTQLTPEEFVS